MGTRRFWTPTLGVLLVLGVAASLAACSNGSLSLADYIASICTANFRGASPDEAPYLAENGSAMSKMMIDMAIKPAGDIDRDFVAMMVPHHQGAIAMAQAELRYGRNERLRRMAQEIIVTQQQEIGAMRLAVGEPPSPPASAPDQSASLPTDKAESTQYTSVQ
jgi:Domain of unknown function (DUF305)